MAKTKAMCIINRTYKLIGIQHVKKHGKGSKNSSIYFDNKMVEEEMEKQVYDGTFDECAYVKDDDFTCLINHVYKCIMYYVRTVLHTSNFEE